MSTLFHATIVSPEDRDVQNRTLVRNTYIITLFFAIFSLINLKDGSIKMMGTTIIGALICFAGGTLSLLFYHFIILYT